MLFSIDKIGKMWYGDKSSFSMTMTGFFSDDDPDLVGLKEGFEAAFKADADAAFRAHCAAALKAEPNNHLLREAIALGLSLL